MSSPNDPNYTPPAAIPEYLIRHTTLRQLQIFEAIVRLGSFTRAAEELFLTQPTVSMQTKKLSDSLGLALFEQIGRNVRPTEAGEELYHSVKNIFQTLANLEMKMSDLKGVKRGRLRVAVITTAKYHVPEVLGEFCQQYPGIEVTLKVSNRERILERINANEDDLYIIGPMDQPDIVAYPYAANPLVVMARRDHPLAKEKNIPLSRIVEEPMILREPGSGIRDLTMRLFDDHGLRPNVRMELGSNEAIKHAIVGGLGISVLSLHSLVLEGSDGPVAVLDVEGFPIIRQWYMVHHKGKELSLVAQTFLDFALEFEPQMRKRIVGQWPSLKEIFDKQLPDSPEPLSS